MKPAETAETADRRFEPDPVDAADALEGAVSAAAVDSGLSCDGETWVRFLRCFARQCKRRGLL